MENNNIDEIIQSLNKLKTKQPRNTEAANIINNFKNYKSINEEYSQKIVNHLKEIENHIDTIESSKKKFFEQLEEIVDPIKKPTKQKVKLFFKQESIISNLMCNQNYRTLYNVFFAFLWILLPNFLINEYYYHSLSDSFVMIYGLLTGITQVFLNTLLLLLTLMAYILFLFPLKAIINKKGILFIYTLSYIYISALFFIRREETLNLSHICKIMYYTEFIRSMLKIWAYFSEKCLLTTYYNQLDIEYSNGNKEVKYENSKETSYISLKDDGEKLEIQFLTDISISGEMKKFAYFYFAPTLIYRDAYPTEANIKVSETLWHFSNFWLSGIFMFLIYKVFIVQYFSENISFLEKESLLKMLVNFIVLSQIVLFVLFFCLFHSLLNFSAQLLRFSDRFFYKPFWSRRSPVNFYRCLVFNYEEFFLYYIRHTYERYLGYFISEFLRVFILIFTFEFIFYRSLKFFSAIIPITIVVSHLITFPFIKVKSQRMILFNWFLVSLILGLFCMIMISDFYFVQYFEEKGVKLEYGGFWLRFFNYYKKNIVEKK